MNGHEGLEREAGLPIVSKQSNTGEKILTIHQGEPFATGTRMGGSHDVDAALAAAARIQETARRIARGNVRLDEIQAWIREGRP